MRSSAKIAAMTLVLSVPAFAQPPADIEDLLGARGAGGETQLQARGYHFVRVNTVQDQKWSFWWNPRTRQCASVTTMDGRYSAISRVPPANCDQDGGPSGSAVPVSSGESLALICWGEGQKTTLENRSGWQWNNDNRRFESTTRLENGKEDFNQELLVEISDGHGHIRLAGALVPPLHSGGRDGWWDLEELQVTRDIISARYRLNGLNKPRLTIDRRIGRISIEGMTPFHGSCEDASKATAKPRF
ncbi:MAG: hypothetical protein ABW048_11945 [Sphingobium sp.]